MNPSESVRQRALASTTGLNEGYVSRVVKKLVEMDLVERDERGIRVTDANRLLDAWHDEYRFDKHTVIRGHSTVAFGESIIQGIARTLSDRGVPYAATGLAAAWQWDPPRRVSALNRIHR